MGGDDADTLREKGTASTSVYEGKERRGPDGRRDTRHQLSLRGRGEPFRLKRKERPLLARGHHRELEIPSSKKSAESAKKGREGIRG